MFTILSPTIPFAECSFIIRKRHVLQLQAYNETIIKLWIILCSAYDWELLESAQL